MVEDTHAHAHAHTLYVSELQCSSRKKVLPTLAPYTFLFNLEYVSALKPSSRLARRNMPCMSYRPHPLNTSGGVWRTIMFYKREGKQSRGLQPFKTLEPKVTGNIANTITASNVTRS